MGCEGNDIDHAVASKLERGTARRQDVIGRQYEAFEPGVHALIVPDPDVNLAAFKHRHLVHAERLRQLHAHVGEAYGVAREESGQDALDRLRRCGDLEHARVSAFEQFYALAERPIWPSTPRQSPSSCSPRVVRKRRRPMRSKSLNPHSCSRSPIWRDKADWLMRRRSAAFDTVPRSATATKVRRRFRPMLISKTHKE